MKFSVSLNSSSGVPYVQYGTDKQKAKATKFVQADNKELTTIAKKINNRKQRDSKFAANIAKAVVAVPFIAGATVAATTKGKVSARTLAGAKSFAKNALNIAVPLYVVDTNAKLYTNNAKVKKAEDKHPLLTLAGLVATATALGVGIEKAMSKVSPKTVETVKNLGKKVKLDKLAAKMDAAPEAIRKVASNVASKVSLPKGVKENLSKLSSKIEMPQILKDGVAKIKNLEATKTASNVVKKGLKMAAKNPGTTAFAVIGAAMVGHVVKNAVELSSTKAKLKEAQAKTANNLILAYAAENDSLKKANAVAADSLEKANSAIVNDNEKEV